LSFLRDLQCAGGRATTVKQRFKNKCQEILLLVGRSRGQLAYHGEETGGGLFINHSVEGHGCRQMWGLRTETHRHQMVPP